MFSRYRSGKRLRADSLFPIELEYHLFDIAGVKDWNASELEKKQRSVGGDVKVDPARTIHSALYGTPSGSDWERMEPHVRARFRAYGAVIEICSHQTASFRPLSRRCI